MRTAYSTGVLYALAIVASAGACSSESIGPATSGVGSMTVIPSRATIGEGQAVQLTARLVDEFGEPLQAEVFWYSSNPSVASVSVGGTVVGRREGRAAITASAHGRAQTAAVQVLRDESGGKPKPPL